MRYYLTPVRMAIIKKTRVGINVEKRESSCTVGENVNWCSHYKKCYGMEDPQKIKKQNYHMIQ